MKTTNAFKKKILYLLLLFSISPGLFQSCYTEDVVDNYFTFTGELIGDYIDNRPERFSEFKRLLDTTGVMGLLKAYGLYTCFLPTNDAMQKYYQDHEKNGAEDFSLAELKTICYNHIIKGDTLATMQFSEGALSSMSMSGRFISVDFSDTTATIFMNGTSPIIEKDIILHNGVVHVLSKAMEPSQDRVSSKLMHDPKFSLFAKAFELTGYRFIMDEAPIEDLTYDPKNYTPSGFRHTVLEELPKYRKFGYTILAESDSTLANYTDCPKLPNGVKTLEDLYTLAEYFYSSKPGNIGLFSDGDEVKDDYTDKRNYLNRYIAYHCMTRTLLSSRFIKDYDTPHHFKIYDMYEYIETMLEDRLLEVKIDRNYSAPNSE
ncbi:MAG TPA: fasciclin domain-containing protein, partial [Bacteroidales bacterium]|nr:fasciclin domain-containing protein [Bacteroidales bacterium]